MDITNVLGLVFFVGLINILLGVIVIPLLRNLGFYKKKAIAKSDELKKKRYDFRHYYKVLGKTLDTPSSFGVILILNLIVLAMFFIAMPPVSFQGSDLMIIFGAILWGVLGLIDDIIQFFFYHLPIGRWGIPATYKLLIQHAISLVVFLAIMPFVPTLSGIAIMGISIIIITFLINAYNITDGLDGLAGGISLITLITFLLFEVLTLNNPFYLILIAVLIGFHLAFLFFNLNPAKVFQGDSGALLIGFILVMIGIRYPLYAIAPLFLLITIEGLSSAIQMMSVKFLKRRVFIIAPLHLNLLNIGVERNTIVFYAWLAQIFLSLVSVYIFSAIK